MASLGGTSLVKAVMLVIKGDSSSADDAITRVAAAAEALKQSMPELAFAIDREKLFEQATIAKALLRSQFSDAIKVPVEPDVSATRSLLDRALLRLGLGGGVGQGGSSLGFAALQALGLVAGGGGAAGTTGAAGVAAGGAEALGAAGLPGGIIGGIGLAGAVDLAGSLVTDLAAATAGVGAFGALAIPTFTTISGAVTQIKADMSALQFAHGTAGVITQAQAQAAAAAQLKADLAALDPAQRKITQGVIGLETEYGKLATQFAPKVEKIALDLLPVAERLLPDVAKFANSAAPAIDQLAKGFAEFTDSKTFKDFVDQMARLSGPAILGIGEGLGKLGAALVRLFAAFPAAGAVRFLTVSLEVLAGILTVLSDIVGRWTSNFERMGGAVVEGGENIRRFADAIGRSFAALGGSFAQAVRDVRNWYDDTVGFFDRVPGDIDLALSGLPGDLEQIGVKAVSGLIHGFESEVGSLLSKAGSWAHSLANEIGSPFGIHFSEPSEATTMVRAGQRIAQGLGKGLDMSAPGGFAGAGAGGLQVTFSWAGGAPDSAIMQQFMQGIRAEVTAKGGGGKNSVQRTFGKVS